MLQWWRNRTKDYPQKVVKRRGQKLSDTLRRVKRGRFKEQAIYVLVACDSGDLRAVETHNSLGEGKRSLLKHCRTLNLDPEDPHDARRDIWLVRICEGRYEEVSAWEAS